MAHPLHDILKRWLNDEQYAFDADTTVHDNFWPSERMPVIHETGGFDEGGGRESYDEPEPQS